MLLLFFIHLGMAIWLIPVFDYLGIKLQIFVYQLYKAVCFHFSWVIPRDGIDRLSGKKITVNFKRKCQVSSNILHHLLQGFLHRSRALDLWSMLDSFSWFFSFYVNKNLLKEELNLRLASYPEDRVHQEKREGMDRYSSQLFVVPWVELKECWAKFLFKLYKIYFVVLWLKWGPLHWATFPTLKSNFYFLFFYFFEGRSCQA